MVHFLDLETDTLINIIEHVRLRTAKGPSNNRILNLAMTCKLLNSLCGQFLFKRYTLVIRSDDNEPLNDLHDLGRYQKEEAKERLSHLRSKIDIIQELTIRDHFNLSDNDPSFLPRAIVRELMKILQLATNLKSLAIDSGTNRIAVLPNALWTWILQKETWEVLVFKGNIRPAQNSESYIGSVEELSVGLFRDGSARFLDLIHPKVLAISYPSYPDNEDDAIIAPFAPGPEHTVNLRHVFMNITLPDNPPHALFDFRGVPQATINVEFDLGVVFYLAVPTAWTDLKSALPRIFVEDLAATYNVKRTLKGASLYRPPLTNEGWRPAFAAHLESDEDAKRATDTWESLYFTSLGPAVQNERSISSSSSGSTEDVEGSYGISESSGEDGDWEDVDD